MGKCAGGEALGFTNSSNCKCKDAVINEEGRSSTKGVIKRLRNTRKTYSVKK